MKSESDKIECIIIIISPTYRFRCCDRLICYQALDSTTKLNGDMLICVIGLGVTHLFENVIPVTTDRPHCLSVVAGGTLVCPVSVAPWGFQFCSFSFLLIPGCV